MDLDGQYKKYNEIEIEVVKNKRDQRPESYRPYTYNKISIIDYLDTNNNWSKRKHYLNNKIRTELLPLLEEARNKSVFTSLALYKPNKVIDFIYEPCVDHWDEKKLAKVEAKERQKGLFDEKNKKIFKLVKKIPFKFSYVFFDETNTERKLMIEDWEVGALYWKMLKKYGNKHKACEMVKEKYFDDFAKTKDLHFYLGTTQKFHMMGAPNPFIIIGTYTPKVDLNLTFDF